MVTDNATPDILYSCICSYIYKVVTCGVQLSSSTYLIGCILYCMCSGVQGRGVTRALIDSEGGVNIHTFVFWPTDIC